MRRLAFGSLMSLLLILGFPGRQNIAGRPASAVASSVSHAMRLSLPTMAFEPASRQAAGGYVATATSRSLSVALGSGGFTLIGSTGARADLRFAGAARHPRIELTNRLPGVVNDLRGPRSRWTANVPRYGDVVYRSLYPGVDLVFHIQGGRLEYDWRVAPHGDLSRIGLRLVGAGSLHAGAGGQLTIRVPGGTFLQDAPRSWQTSQENRAGVRYVTTGSRSTVLRPYNYDAFRALVVDPAISFSTYLGGTNYDGFDSEAVDGSGNVFAAGFAASAGLPATAGAIGQAFNGGQDDGMLAKYSPTGTLLYLTYLGSSGYDSASAIAVEPGGTLLVGGTTIGADFPPASGPPLSPAAGATDSWTIRLNAAGNSMLASYRISGTGYDNGYAIREDAAGDIFVAGTTSSTDLPMRSAFQGTYGGGERDLFVFKLNHALTAIDFSTYLGGSGSDDLQDMRLSGGNIILTGYTNSDNYPTTPAALQIHPGSTGACPTNSDQSRCDDLFATSLAGDGSHLVYSTYMGGQGSEYGGGMVIDAAGNVIVSGATNSPDIVRKDGLAGPEGAQHNANCVSSGTQYLCFDALIFSLNPAGTLLWSTTLGTNGEDYGGPVTVDPAGNVIVTGYTASTDFPAVNPMQAPPPAGLCQSSPCPDVFVSVIAKGNTGITFSSRFGSAEDDFPNAVEIDSSGAVLVVGSTYGSGFPVVNAAQSQHAGASGSSDGFVLKLTGIAGQALPPPPAATATSTPRPTATPLPTGTPLPTSVPTRFSIKFKSLVALNSLKQRQTSFKRGDLLGTLAKYAIAGVDLTVPVDATQSFQYGWMRKGKLAWDKGPNSLHIRGQAANGVNSVLLSYTIPRTLPTKYRTIKITMTLTARGQTETRTLQIAISG